MDDDDLMGALTEQLIEFTGIINNLKSDINRLQCDIDGAKVSLDKCFDSEYSHDLTNQACDVREMYCKLGDENARLRDALEELYNAGIKDEKGLTKALFVIGKEINSRRWMADTYYGAQGMSFDEFRSTEVLTLLDTIEGTINKALNDSYPTYDDAMTKAKQAIKAGK